MEPYPRKKTTKDWIVISSIFGIIILLSFLWVALHVGGPPFSETAVRAGQGLSVSPSGKSIVFSTARTGEGDIYKVNSNGTRMVALTSNDQVEGDPDYSPDGESIVYAKLFWKTIGHKADLWIMDSNGANQRPLTNSFSDDSRPKFVTNTLVAFTRCDGWVEWNRGRNNGSEIWLIDLTTGKETRLTDDADPQWLSDASPDGKSLCFSGRHPIWILNLDTRKQQQVAKGLAGSFSPSGKQFVMLGGRFGQQLEILNTDGTGARTVYSSQHFLHAPVFLPDGSGLIFRENQTSQWDYEGELRHLDLKTGKVHTIIADHALGILR